MNNSYITILIIVGIIWCIGLFFSFVTGIKKSFSNPPAKSSIKAESLKTKEKRLSAETEDKRKQFMEDYQQKMRDNQRKF